MKKDTVVCRHYRNSEQKYMKVYSRMVKSKKVSSGGQRKGGSRIEEEVLGGR
jgi:hypothetical protein